MPIYGCGGNKKPVNPTTVTTPASSPEQMKWTYQINAISFKLGVDKNLNQYDGAAHTLLLCFYQLSNLSKFNELAGTSTGVEKMLNCTSFDHSVTQVKREFVQPGQNSTIVMDRAEGTKFIGVVAGYYDYRARDRVLGRFPWMSAKPECSGGGIRGTLLPNWTV
jgi:predicted component of type VI protein secretion system